ncbi:MAG: hypothetical protein OEZ68_12950 [Gammaproteobacteria bacterium]|nr:hypothetical protein [Gammaproteobacteria bacterium]MDH5801706.1 hypothetical protein [Gammaproteobacteria bacterium]
MQFKILIILLSLLGLPGCATVAKTTSQPAPHPMSDPWVGQDKVYHALASAAIARIAALEADRHSSSKCAPLAVGLVVTLSAGTAKELYDRDVRKTLFSWRDMFWNTFGALLGSLSVSSC